VTSLQARSRGQEGAGEELRGLPGPEARMAGPVGSGAKRTRRGRRGGGIREESGSRKGAGSRGQEYLCAAAHSIQVTGKQLIFNLVK
jgi:hypothetical protein